MQLRPASLTPARRGSILLSSMILVVAMAGMTVALLAFSMNRSDEVRFTGQETRALYVAEAGIAESVLALAVARDAGQPPPGELGSALAPLQLAGGSFWSTIADNGDGSFTIRVDGRSRGNQRSLEVRLEPDADSAFDHAIFAGNSSGDPGYTLNLGGSGGQADAVNGNIYSGGSIQVDGDAAVNGDLVAAGGIASSSGSTLTTGETKPILDIAAQDYANTSDVDVAAIFAAESFSAAAAIGGTADQVPSTSPAHIFRRNPSDRPSEIAGTAKDDDFLEDPYEPATSFASVFANGHEVTLSGTAGDPGPNGNELVYYIDGNLWIHSAPMGGLRIDSDGAGTRITFVVRGNLYIADDVLLDDPDNDAIAFIAVADPSEPDSGNIYLGDPRWGTLELMNAYLYAENNFYDNNLDENGSLDIVLNGNMTAGNQVDIQRDYVKTDGSIAHSRLEVNFDDRVSSGTIQLPGLPQPVTGIGGMSVAYWSEAAER